MIKPTGNSVVLNATHVDVSTTSRYQRIYNSHASAVANVEIGSNSTNVEATIMVGPGQSVTIDTGSGTRFASLNVNVATVYRTPVAGGS